MIVLTYFLKKIPLSRNSLMRIILFLMQYLQHPLYAGKICVWSKKAVLRNVRLELPAI